jgi:hypothetical protein
MQNANGDVSALFMRYGLKVSATALLIDLPSLIRTFFSPHFTLKNGRQ